MPLSSDSESKLKQLQERLKAGGLSDRDRQSLETIIDDWDNDAATDNAVSDAYSRIYEANKTTPANTDQLNKSPDAQDNTTQQGTSSESYTPSSGVATTTPSSSSGTGSTVEHCNSNLTLDKRLKIFRTHDKVLWFFWIDDISDYGSTTQTATVFSIIDFKGVKVNTEALEDQDSVLFFSKTLNESFNLPTDSIGTINSNVLWAVYLEGNKYKPIHGVKFMDMHYDPDNHSLDVVFWANVNVDDLENGEVSYPDSLEDVEDAANLSNAQRVVFYTRGTYQDVISTRTGKEKATGMFIFTKPILFLSPGHADDEENNAVVDEVPGFTFLEFN